MKVSEDQNQVYAGGMTGEAVAAKGYEGCTRCCFLEYHRAHCPNIPCRAIQRNDGKAVYFKKVKLPSKEINK